MDQKQKDKISKIVDQVVGKRKKDFPEQENELKQENKGSEQIPIEPLTVHVPRETTHKPTKSWDQGDNPWSRNMLRLKKKKPGFRNRFVHKDPENVERYLEQGWQIADKRDYGGVADNIVGEEGELDTRVKRRELILLEIPEELAKKRDEYIDYKTNRQARELAQKSLKGEGQELSKAYGREVFVEDRWDSRKGRHV